MKNINTTTAYFRDDFIDFKGANLSIASAPVLYGLSVYTVIPVFWDKRTHKLYIFRLKDYFRRLQNSAKIMAFNDFLEAWDYPKFEEKVTKLIKLNDVQCDALVRVSVFVDDILKGTRIQGLRHSVSAFIYPMTDIITKKGAELMVSSWQRTPDNAIPARAKINGNYANAALMKHEAQTNGYDDAIALDGHGHVTESTVANLFMVRNNVLITPHTSTDILEGITRDSVLKIAKASGIETEERYIDRSELYIADEIFLCGSSMKIVPVKSVDRRPIGKSVPGTYTLEIQKGYNLAFFQEAKLFSSWLTLVV
ncbi:MAG: aminotransferase class IV [Candidatus Saccharimonadales bacterium]